MPALDVDTQETVAADKWAEGHRAFKLKIAFDPARDRRNLAALREALGTDANLMVDANQSWNVAEAVRQIGELSRFDLTWVEEPLPADGPLSHWLRLAREVSVPLAAGENVRGEDAFAELIATGAIRHFQPDIAKWGGLTGGLRVARRVLDAGHLVSPHFMGGGIGLLASAHCLAAAGGGGYLEFDANDNPLRTDLIELPAVENGTISLPEAPGLGPEPDFAAVESYRV